MCNGKSKQEASTRKAGGIYEEKLNKKKKEKEKESATQKREVITFPFSSSTFVGFVHKKHKSKLLLFSLLCLEFQRLINFAMDFVSPVLEVASRICNCVGDRADHLRRLPQNLKSLRTETEKLKNVYKDVKERVEREENLEKNKRTHVVDGWIGRAEAMEKEVNELLDICDEENQKKCLGTCCPRNCRSNYKLAKMVREKMDAVAELQSEGSNFQEVAVPLPSPLVIERPLEEKPVVGLDSPFREVWRLLQDKQVGSIGLYGMGGVGKTTLLKKINNKFLQSSIKAFDIVIWVVVSRPTNLERVQETILDRLDIPDDRWKGRAEERKADEIRRVLKTKKFVLLLDDIWEPLDLLRVGIPPLGDGNQSKIVFTTRSADLCRGMAAQKSIKVECLEDKEALSLFQAKVGEDTLNSHPEIPKLAKMVAKECEGLPLALIVIARAMASAKTPEEWESDLKKLRLYPKDVAGTENDLFSVLAFSYDSLPDEATKSCFLYCSLFPEDYKIPSKHLIQLWIGEGFLDEYDDIQEARNQGGKIIQMLTHACLLEEGAAPVLIDGEYLKMHDVIRDMALWLACEKGKKKNKFVVKDGVGLISAQEVQKWKDAQRIALWNETSIEELREPPRFPNTETVIGRMTWFMTWFMFPSGFFTNMSNIRVLDFSNTELRKLPAEIGNLATLQYLNLSDTMIEYLPIELKNLKKLRFLMLDCEFLFEPLPYQMVSSLSSLQLFSMKFLSLSLVDEIMLLEELEQLEHINDISIRLTSIRSIQRLFESHKLRRSTTFLQLQGCWGVNQVQLVSPSCIKELVLERCFELEEVKIIHFEKQVVPSKFPNPQCCFNHLLSVRIKGCTKFLNLNWLIHAPKLQYLQIQLCLIEKVIEDERSEGSEIESGLSVFSRLIYLTLIDLPKLESIYEQPLPFPSLRQIIVRECPKLKKLPFDSSICMSKKLEKIEGQQEWWDGLEWNDQTLKHNLTPYFIEA